MSKTMNVLSRNGEPEDGFVMFGRPGDGVLLAVSELQWAELGNPAHLVVTLQMYKPADK